MFILTKVEKRAQLRRFISMEFDDLYFMRQAIREAVKAFEEDEVPVGAVIVSKNKSDLYNI